MLTHPERAAVLAEVHARPFYPVAAGGRLLHYAFMTDARAAAADRQRLTALCNAEGVAAPGPYSKHLRTQVFGAAVRWEQHAEFTTYTWEVNDLDEIVAQSLMARLDQPGAYLASVDLKLQIATPNDIADAFFDASSLAMARVDDGCATVATDFHADPNGHVRIVVEAANSTANQLGALAQRVLEVETYRVLALLGLPEAHRVAPTVREFEDALIRVAGEMAENEDFASDRKLLAELTALAARLEASAARSSYRFRASHAYLEIMRQRLQALREEPIDGMPTLSAFLDRRVAPAMRTCAMLEDRQRELAQKLMRAANLLRTRVEVEISRQNRDLLASMNNRTSVQLRLQRTVEGLSIAAISYYIVGLVGYFMKGLKEFGAVAIEPAIVVGAAVPLAILVIATLMWRIRRKHADAHASTIGSANPPAS